MKHTLAIATLLVSAFPALAGDQNKLDANPSLFSVMAALQAAGYKTADTPFAEIVRTRQRLRLQIRALTAQSRMGGMIVVAIALAVVALILAAGLATLWIGGDTQRRWSNRLMRYRILAQFVAIVVILAVFYFTRSH